ncbi:hypothetical protein [Actinocorallia sp. B10E7]|uniref:hypothetical protein n=1 Tax=Actinocorallia sp. B10E7 TaxID=3153558 RepID=UPI00325F9C85
MKSAKRWAVGVGLALTTAGLHTMAAPASAAPGQCRLSIDNSPAPDEAIIRALCTPFSEADRFLSLEIWGSDQWYNDFRHSLFSPTLYYVRIRKSILNEDFEGRDEIYVKAVYQKPDGKRYKITSNVVTGHW